ncbi:unnamed protein product [Onchocerca ochengi]|uniref:Fructose-bisphosphate aldolase class I n=1 Tax=Onchocerca ochengi TaxID=42157 RepID=A0A182E8R5_ONCOC|nr:unnamed protein product [Onchocerca ochengi]
MVNTILQIRAWAESKKDLPGKFTGSTGVNILKADQLGPDDPRFNVWAKKRFSRQATSVISNRPYVLHSPYFRHEP